MEIKGLSVPVTGGCGFLGSWIVEDLLARGAAVTVYDNLTRRTQDNLKSVEKDVKLIPADIRDQQKVYKDVRASHTAHTECKAIVLDNSRARRLGWVPRVTLPAGIKRQLDWLRANPTAWD